MKNINSYSGEGIFYTSSDKLAGPILSYSGENSAEKIKFTATSGIPSLTLFDFTPDQQLVLKEQIKSDHLNRLSFCLGDSIEWSFTGLDVVFRLEKNESCLMTNVSGECISKFDKGKHYYGVGISFDPAMLLEVAHFLNLDSIGNEFESLQAGLKRKVITPRISGILSQLIDSHICQGLKNIYMEAKILELLAVYLNEIIEDNGKTSVVISLSREDIEALNYAREILDKTFVEPMTLFQLSRKVYLNEYKLKTGFKQYFGQTIYSYILNKRMEMAKVLIEQKRFKVKDIAGLVGYSNTSHFIAAFRRKYGATPGELLNN